MELTPRPVSGGRRGQQERRECHPPIFAPRRGEGNGGALALWVRAGFKLQPPKPDVPGQWAAHCLDFDVVTQGNDPEHAMKMIREAVEIVVEDDLAKGFDLARRRAPQEEWDELGFG